MRPTAVSVTDSRPQVHRPLAAGIRLARDLAQGERDQNSCANQQRGRTLGATGVACPSPLSIMLLSLALPWAEPVLVAGSSHTCQ